MSEGQLILRLAPAEAPTYVFDIETDGLLDEVTRVHVLVIKSLQHGWVSVFRRRPGEADAHIREGIAALVTASRAGRLIAHNGICYDVAVLRKLYPAEMQGFNDGAVYDTIVASRLAYSDGKEFRRRDLKKWQDGKFPGQLLGRHSLEAWGHRLGCHKGDYKGGWERWSQEMEDYCVQDVVVTEKLYAYLGKQQLHPHALDIEMGVQWVIARQERRGFAFNVLDAAKLYAELVDRRLTLEKQLSQQFQPFYVPDGKLKTVSKSRVMRKGVPCPTYYEAGAQYLSVKLIDFNPGSRDHISNRLMKLYGWKPKEFGEDGKPTVDENVLRSLKYPGVDLLIEYLMVDKRIGQLAEGKEAWLRHVRDGYIHGRVVTNGAVTGRMTHEKPNVAQVPSVRAPYGEQCRALFSARPGYVLVGADAAALELRCLAGFMARFDGGSYIQTVLNSDDPEVKARGDDLHSINCRAIGLDPKQLYFGTEKGRDIAKTWFYAFIYGAGDGKLGSIILRLPAESVQARRKGAETREKFLKGLAAMGKLVEALKDRIAKKGFILGVDGRRLPLRSSHASLNTLLQSAGAVFMKRALLILDADLQSRGLKPGDDYEFLANVHDEWQIECREHHATLVGEAAKAAIREAGEWFRFPCPLDGNFIVGKTWADTH